MCRNHYALLTQTFSDLQQAYSMNRYFIFLSLYATDVFKF
jgi:hypothetical protein